MLLIFYAINKVRYGVDYQKKIDACKQKMDEAKSEAATDTEINLLEKELEGELQREQMLREELR